MPIAMSCRCGQVRGEVDIHRAYARATCYCKDCQAYARFLGTPGITDAQGGSDVVPLTPAAVKFESGLDQVACMMLSEKGIMRWYAACCRTPLGNTPRDANIPYVGMSSVCFAATEDAIDDVLGPRGRTVLNARSAVGKVSSTPLPFVMGGLSILANIVVRRLRGEGREPFFAASGQPLRQPEVLSTAQREALGANHP